MLVETLMHNLRTGAHAHEAGVPSLVERPPAKPPLIRVVVRGGTVLAVEGATPLGAPLRVAVVDFDNPPRSGRVDMWTVGAPADASREPGEPECRPADSPSDEQYIAAARESYARAGEAELDDTPRVSRGDGGAYVQAWVWVYDDDVQG